MLAIFKMKDRRVTLNLFAFTVAIFAPFMLVFNFWGNHLIQQIETNEKCKLNDKAQSFELLYLVSTYCTIFMFMIFTVVIRECLKRYYVAIEINPTILRSSFNPDGFEVHIFSKRSYQDW